jgi:hypothetical protein
MSEQSIIHMVLRKDVKWGRVLYYTTKKEDVWLPVIHNQQSLTEHDVKYLKQTGRFTFELMREEI